MFVDDLNIKDYNYFLIVYFKDIKIQKEVMVIFLNKSISMFLLDFKIVFYGKYSVDIQFFYSFFCGFLKNYLLKGFFYIDFI